MTDAVELAIIGAGPAGMAAATLADELGLPAVVYDEQPAPGGQIYRDAERVRDERPDDLALLGPDYGVGLALIAAFRGSGAQYCPGTSVWDIGHDGRLGLLDTGGARIVSARRIVIASGAAERPMPIPGWTLPGVLSAGAAQTLLKTSGLVPEGPVILAGGGPLIVLVAWQMQRAGVPIDAILLTAPRRQRLAALPHLLKGLRDMPSLAKGWRWQRELQRAGIEIVDGVTALAAEGESHLEVVRFQDAAGNRRSVDCRLLLLHDGVIPNTQLSRVAGCAHLWDAMQRAWRPQADIFGATTIESIAIAGDGAGIGGAEAAATRGRLAAIDAAHRLGRIDRAEFRRRAAIEQRALSRQLALRPFLDVWFRPADWLCAPPDDDTVVCRCEEVTAGELRRVAATGCLGPNQAKSFTRAGMGPCQGRMCGTVVSEIFAAAHGIPVADAGYYRIRPPIKPVTVGEAAGLAGAGDVCEDMGGSGLGPSG